jgi:predicted PurR-regulated permease PerM
MKGIRNKEEIHMEKRLFNLYLKYIEECCPSVWKMFTQIPSKLKKYMCRMIMCYLGSVIGLLVLDLLNECWSKIDIVIIIVFLSLCVFFEVRLFIATEKYEIEISDKTMQEYWNYCYEIRRWFSKDFVTLKQTGDEIDENLKEVKKRIDIYLENQAKKNEHINTRIDKWVQALAIPFVLAVITASLDKNDTITIAISEIFAIILVFFAFFGGAWIIYSIVRLFKKQKYEQMKSFSEDLQGALDCVKYSKDMKWDKDIDNLV